MNASTIPNVRD